MSKDHWAMVQRLCDREEGLTEWECNFVSDLMDRGDAYNLSARQIETLERIDAKF